MYTDTYNVSVYITAHVPRKYKNVQNNPVYANKTENPNAPECVYEQTVLQSHDEVFITQQSMQAGSTQNGKTLI